MNTTTELFFKNNFNLSIFNHHSNSTKGFETRGTDISTKTLAYQALLEQTRGVVDYYNTASYKTQLNLGDSSIDEDEEEEEDDDEDQEEDDERFLDNDKIGIHVTSNFSAAEQAFFCGKPSETIANFEKNYLLKI